MCQFPLSLSLWKPRKGKLKYGYISTFRVCDYSRYFPSKKDLKNVWKQLTKHVAAISEHWTLTGIIISPWGNFSRPAVSILWDFFLAIAVSERHRVLEQTFTNLGSWHRSRTTNILKTKICDNFCNILWHAQASKEFLCLKYSCGMDLELCWKEQFICNLYRKRNPLADNGHLVFSSPRGQNNFMVCFLYSRGTIDKSQVLDISIWYNDHSIPILWHWAIVITFSNESTKCFNKVRLKRTPVNFTLL